MSDYNYTNQPEPVVTVKRPLFSKNGVLLLAVLGVVAIAGGVSFHLLTQPLPVPEVQEVVEIPLSEAETEEYRSNLDRVFPPDATDNPPQEVELTESAAEIVSDEAVVAQQKTQAEAMVFVPPPAAQPVDVTTYISEDVNTVPAPAQTETVSKTAFIEGDVEILDFTVDAGGEQNIPISITGAVHANDTSSKQMIVSSDGKIYTLKTDSVTITTKEGKLLSQSSLKNGDLLTIDGLRSDDSQTILVQRMVLTGVQDYLASF